MVKSCKEENKNSTHGAELKLNSICGVKLKQNSICGAELQQRRQENEMTKDEFCASYLTRKKPNDERRKMLPIWKEDRTPLKK